MNISRKSSLSTRRWSRSINNETFSGPGSTNPDRFENASFSPPPPKPRSDITPYSPLKSNNRRKKITLTPSPNEQSFQASIRPWIQSSEVNPAIPPPIPLAHSFARAHKHFFHLSVAQSLPCLPIRTKALYFFFFFLSSARSSFVHLSTPPLLFLHPPRIYQRDFHRSVDPASARTREISRLNFIDGSRGPVAEDRPWRRINNRIMKSVFHALWNCARALRPPFDSRFDCAMGESAMPINRSTVEHHIARERERGAFPVKTIATNPRHTLPPPGFSEISQLFRPNHALPNRARAAISLYGPFTPYYARAFRRVFWKFLPLKPLPLTDVSCWNCVFFFLLFSFFFRVVGLLGYSPRLFPCFSNVCSFVRFAWLIEICEDG